MVALSRLKVSRLEKATQVRGSSWTFWPKYENMGSRLAKEWHVPGNRAAMWGAPGHFQRCTRYSTPPPKATWDCGKCTSEDHLSQRVLRLQAIWSWSGKKTSFFREVTVAWAQAYGQGDSLVSLQQVQRWPCGYSPPERSNQSRSLLGVPCHCSFTQPNTCIHWFTGHNSCGHSPFLMRTSSWMAYARSSLWHTLLVRKVFHSKLTAWKIWLPRKSSRVETERG